MKSYIYSTTKTTSELKAARITGMAVLRGEVSDDMERLHEGVVEVYSFVDQLNFESCGYTGLHECSLLSVSPPKPVARGVV